MKLNNFNPKRVFQILGLVVGISLTGCQNTENKKIDGSSGMVEVDASSTLATFDRKELQKYGKDFILVYDVYERQKDDTYQYIGKEKAYEQVQNNKYLYSLEQVQIVPYRKGDMTIPGNEILEDGEWNLVDPDSQLKVTIRGNYGDYVFEYQNSEKSTSDSLYSFSFSKDNLLSDSSEEYNLLGMYSVKDSQTKEVTGNTIKVSTSNGDCLVRLDAIEEITSHHK